MQPSLTSPNELDTKALAKQCAFINQTISERYPGNKLNQTLQDLGLIQKMIDDGVFDASQTWELQSLGVAFGSVFIANNSEFHWAIITDEYGRDPTVRFRDTSLTVNFLTMISKRIEDGRAVNVQELYDSTLKHAKDVNSQFI